MKKKYSLHLILIAFILITIMMYTLPSYAASAITVNTASSQGALMYGGIGFLYGLGIQSPNDSMITGLVHPQYTGQNAPNGLQHPDGYADKVAPQAKRTGFKGVDIYCQDIYPNWPYNNNGISDYVSKLQTMARIIVADPNRSFYQYNIFNEPDNNWYGSNVTQMCNDWKTCYNAIKAIDPTARTMGPSYAGYNSSTYSTFFNFCKNNNCMPDVAVWHELFDSFYTSWYSHYNSFRSINSTIPININEYARSTASGSYNDLGVPGNLIQYLAKFENSNVYGCLAFWYGIGNLDDLVANNNTNQKVVGTSYNQPTGAYYLYQWYGQMTGNQVAVTLPSQEGSLQAIASKDGSGNVTVLFGGSGINQTYDCNVALQGLSGSSINYTVYETKNTGRNASAAPSVKKSGTASVSGGNATISVTGCAWDSAFKVSITPGPGGGATPTPTQPGIATPTPTGAPGTISIEAEASTNTLAGTAVVRSVSTCSGGKDVGNVGQGSGNYLQFNNVYKASAGSMTLRVYYINGDSGNRTASMSVNGGTATTVTFPPTGSWTTVGNVSINVTLNAGNNTIKFSNSSAWAPDFDILKQ